MSDPVFQETITAVTLARDGVQYSLARPPEMEPLFFHAEDVPAGGRVKGGERVTLFAGDIRVAMMAHAGQRAARVSLDRVGKQRFNPLLR